MLTEFLFLVAGCTLRCAGMRTSPEGLRTSYSRIWRALLYDFSCRVETISHSN